MRLGFVWLCAIGMSSNSGYLDVFNLSPSSTSTSRKPTSSVRSRNRRLISLIDGDNEDGTQQLTSTAPALRRSPLHSREATPSPYGSRRGSPLPTKHSSSVSIQPGNDGSWRRNDGHFSSDSSLGEDITALRNGPKFAAGLLESSWSSLQGLASSVLGSDVGWAKSGINTATSYRQRKPSRSNINTLSKTSTPLWGPSAPSTSLIGAGTEEERRELVRAKRRELLLLANGDSVSDLKGRYKRRDSSDRPDQETEPEPDDDAFVYVHHVQPTDSVTGVTIRYGCQPAIFKKANGFWPSDSIQSRKVVLLPVESCSVKGRRVSSPPSQDLLQDYDPSRDSLEDMNGSSIYPVPVSTIDRLPNETNLNNEEDDQQWKHEAWVEIEGFPTAIEIGRIPRRALGFFPRTRRKSNSTAYTDDGGPPTSLYSSLSQFPSNPSMFPRSLRPSDDPSSSLSPSPDRSRVTKFGVDPSALTQQNRRQHDCSNIFLSGPGGVGSLGQDAKAPGPAPDSLNTFFAQHLPDLTPPPPIERRKTSFESTSSTIVSNASSNGYENVGGAIEIWMRKMATRAKAGLNELQQSGHGQQGHSPGHAIGISGFGDLIELNDGLEGTTPPTASTAAREYPVSSRSRSNPLSESSLLRDRHPSPSASIVGRARPPGFGLSAVPDDHRKKGEKGD
jgi:hypothetical protein